MKYTLSMTFRSVYSISLKAFHGNSWLFWGLSNVWISGGQSYVRNLTWKLSDGGQTTRHHISSWTGLDSRRMGVEMDPSHWDYRCSGEVLGRWEMLLQSPATAGLSLSHGMVFGQEMEAEKCSCNEPNHKGQPGCWLAHQKAFYSSMRCTFEN